VRSSGERTIICLGSLRGAYVYEFAYLTINLMLPKHQQFVTMKPLTRNLILNFKNALKLTYSNVEIQSNFGLTPPDPAQRGREGEGKGKHWTTQC